MKVKYFLCINVDIKLWFQRENDDVLSCQTVTWVLLEMKLMLNQYVKGRDPKMLGPCLPFHSLSTSSMHHTHCRLKMPIGGPIQFSDSLTLCLDFLSNANWWSYSILFFFFCFFFYEIITFSSFIFFSLLFFSFQWFSYLIIDVDTILHPFQLHILSLLLFLSCLLYISYYFLLDYTLIKSKSSS